MFIEDFSAAECRKFKITKAARLDTGKPFYKVSFFKKSQHMGRHLAKEMSGSVSSQTVGIFPWPHHPPCQRWLLRALYWVGWMRVQQSSWEGGARPEELQPLGLFTTNTPLHQATPSRVCSKTLLYVPPHLERRWNSEGDSEISCQPIYIIKATSTSTSFSKRVSFYN